MMWKKITIMTGMWRQEGIAAVLILLLCLSGRSFAEEDGPGRLWEVFRDFNETASSFDPVGHALNPIEEFVPNLYLRGMLRNRTMMDLHGHSDCLPYSGSGHDDCIPNGSSRYGKSKHYDFQFIEWLGELEAQYPLTSHISLVNIDDFLYDSAFDWEGAGRLGADGLGRHLLSEKVAREREYYRTSKQILRELYAEVSYGDWFFRLGKQQVIWGKMDGKVIDIINPTRDWLGPTATQDNYKWTRIPLWLANAVYTWRDLDLQLIWTPDFEPNQGPPPGDVFSRSSGYEGGGAQRRVVSFHPFPHHTPSHSLKNSEFGLRTNLIQKGWDLGAIYWYAWDDNPTRFRRGIEIGDQGKIQEKLELAHTRLHHFGFNLDKSFGFQGRNWVWRLESLYTLNSYLPTRGERLRPQEKVIDSRRDGVTRVNQILSAAALETSALHGNLSILFQASNRHLFKYSRQDMGPPESGKDPMPSLKTKRDQTIWQLGLSYTFSSTGDRLSVGATHYNVLEEGEWKGRYLMAYKLSDFLRLSAEYTWFSGHSDDPNYGMWNNLDQLRIGLTYNF